MNEMETPKSSSIHGVRMEKRVLPNYRWGFGPMMSRNEDFLAHSDEVGEELNAWEGDELPVGE